MDGVAAVAAARVVEVDDVELRFHLVPLRVVQKMVVGNHGEVGKLEVVHIHRVTLLYLLLDEIVHHGIRLAAARRAQHDGGAEGINHVDPAPVPTLAVVEACGQVHGIVVLQQPCLLHETLVFRVEHILHQIVLQQTAHPQPAHQQAYVARADGSDVQLRKNSTQPIASAARILLQVIFSPFTPFVPRQERASRSTANSFV